MVEHAVGECFVKVNVVQKDWYDKFTIAIYSSEIIHMYEPDLVCNDYVPEDWDVWHLDVSDRYDCAMIASIFTNGDCSGYNAYTGDGWSASEACVDCGGGICTAEASSTSSYETGHYEYSKPTWFSMN